MNMWAFIWKKRWRVTLLYLTIRTAAGSVSIPLLPYKIEWIR